MQNNTTYTTEELAELGRISLFEQQLQAMKIHFHEMVKNNRMQKAATESVQKQLSSIQEPKKATTVVVQEPNQLLKTSFDDIRTKKLDFTADDDEDEMVVGNPKMVDVVRKNDNKPDPSLKTSKNISMKHNREFGFSFENQVRKVEEFLLTCEKTANEKGSSIYEQNTQLNRIETCAWAVAMNRKYQFQNTKIHLFCQPNKMMKFDNDEMMKKFTRILTQVIANGKISRITLVNNSEGMTCIRGLVAYQREFFPAPPVVAPMSVVNSVVKYMNGLVHSDDAKTFDSEKSTNALMFATTYNMFAKTVDGFEILSESEADGTWSASKHKFMCLMIKSIIEQAVEKNLLPNTVSYEDTPFKGKTVSTIYGLFFDKEQSMYAPDVEEQSE